MYKISGKQLLNNKIKKIEIVAPELCKRLSVGQFVIITPTEKLFGVPLTTIDVDPIKGTLGVVFESTNPVLSVLGDLKIGDSVFAIDGPLGKPIELEKYGSVLCISEGICAINNCAIARKLRQAGNKVVGMASFETKADRILETQLRSNCDNVKIIVNESSQKTKEGFTVALKDILDKKAIDVVFVSGTIAKMQEVVQLTKEYKIKTFVNVIEILEYGLKHNAESVIRLDNKRTFLTFESLIRKASSKELQSLAEQIQQLKEYGSCQQLMSKQLRRKSTFTIFPKILKGLTRSKS